MEIILFILIGIAVGVGFYLNSKKKKTTTGTLTLKAADTLAVVSQEVEEVTEEEEEESEEPIGTLAGITSVVVKFYRVELGKTEDEEEPTVFILEQPVTLDLLASADSNTLLEGQVIEAGEYEWIRLIAMTARDTRDSYVVENGTQVPLFIPSGAQSGLKLVDGFTVPEGGEANFTIDFDLKRSLIKPGKKTHYMLKPVLKLIDNN